jgi:hypothetical protein
MSFVFGDQLGQWAVYLFIIAGVIALFTSILGPLYGFSRLWEEGFEQFGLYDKFKIKKKTVFRICLVFFTLLPFLYGISSIFLGIKPMWLFSQASYLTGPILGLVYIIPIIVAYLVLKDKAPDLVPKRYWAIALAVISGVLMIILSLMSLFIF